MAVPSGVIISWPSTVASIPAGWSRVTALDTYFPRPNATATGTGGSLSHTHTATAHSHTNHSHAAGGDTGGPSYGFGAMSAGAGAAAQTPAYNSGTGHTHQMPASDVDASSSGTSSATASSSGSFALNQCTAIFIQSAGTHDYPSGGYAWWHNSGTAPTNWAIADGTGGTLDLRNYYFRGAAAAGDGGTKTAASSHTHTHSHTHTGIGSHSHGTLASAGTSSPNSGGNMADGSTEPYVSIGHTHAWNGTESATASGSSYSADASASASATPDPPYYKLHHIKKTSADSVEPSYLIAMTVGSVPSGYYACDGANGTPNLNGNNYFVKGANGDAERQTTGGTTTHSHTLNHQHNESAPHTHAAGSMAWNSGGSSSGRYGDAADGSFENYTSGWAHTHSGGSGWQFGGSAIGSSNDALTADANSSVPPYYNVIFIMKSPNTAPTITSAPVATYATLTRTGPSNTWGLTFTAHDAEQTGANAITYYVYTGASRTGSQIATGTCTNDVSKVITGLAYNIAGLADGSNTLYLSVYDGFLYSADSSFTLLRDDVSPTAATTISHTPNPVI